MGNITKRYSKDEITVLWKPDLCIHSKKCWHGLPGVFNPEQRPWVNMDGAGKTSIVDQVKACPSGALSIEGEPENTDQTAITTVKVTKGGPLLVQGNLTITKTDGEQVEKQGMTALCRCGASKNKPFCDGSHSQVDFDS